MAFFNVNSLMGNPFATPIGQKIEQATDRDEEDVSLNIEICDMINESEDGPRDAMKAIRKRITHNAGKNPRTVMLTLTVLEMCVKNCGHRFHLLSSQKDFIHELVKLIGPKNEPPVQLQERVLRLVQEWAETFGNQPHLNGVHQVYQELLQKRIEFPPKNLDAMVPILTPSPTCYDHPVIRTNKPRRVKKSLNPEQRAKLLSELDVVQTNVSILSEMLNETNPTKENADDVHLMKDLVKTCTEMQSRILVLIEQLTSDEITAELLRINDELNNAFLRYSRWTKKRLNNSNDVKDSGSGDKSNIVENHESLIDFEPSSSAKKNLGSSDEFETFIKDRKVKNVVEGDDGDQLDHLNEDEERQFTEIAAWLQDNKISSSNSPSAVNSRVGSAMTSTEFDKFLAERVAVAETESAISPTKK